MATADEAEIEAEVEAVQAVYGDDCVVIDSYPPHLHVHIKPRTADVTSQQVPLIFYFLDSVWLPRKRGTVKKRKRRRTVESLCHILFFDSGINK
jgi:hypothetical protein